VGCPHCSSTDAAASAIPSNKYNPQKKLFRDDKLHCSSAERSFHGEIALGSTEV